MQPLVCGADLGGTSTRVTISDLSGYRHGIGRAGGGNPTTHGAAAAAESLSIALRAALADLDPARVRALVLGLAGGGALIDPRVAAVYDDMLRSIGVRVAPIVVGDALCAFTSATAEPDGTVLLAGTGAAAARVRGRHLHETADGWGWLLGDHGSAYWIGRAAVRAVLAEVGGVGPPTTLRAAVCAALLDRVPGDPIQDRNELINAAGGRPAIHLATLATLVVAGERSGDAASAQICDRAAELLCDTVSLVRDADEATPIVVNGSVVRAADSPVGSRVRTLLAERFTGAVLAPTDGTLGATWLAIRAVDPGGDLAAAHQRLGDAANPAPAQ